MMPLPSPPVRWSIATYMNVIRRRGKRDMKPNHHSARPELVEGPFFLSTPNKKDGASTSSAQTAWESATPDGPAAPFASDATTREARREQQHGRRGRSEEHTSELQSLMRISYAVFCLKKKTDKKIINNKPHHTATNRHNVDTRH